LSPRSAAAAQRLVVIVGAGVLGVSVARQLAVAGEDVLLLDRRGADTDTTATTFAWTNCKPEPGPPPAEPRRDGRGAPSYFPSGALQWADAANEQRLADNVERLQALGYPAHWVTPDEAARTAGGLRIPATITSIAHFPSEGYVRSHFAIGEVVAVNDGPDRVSVTWPEARSAQAIESSWPQAAGQNGLPHGRFSARLAHVAVGCP
jgi:glycine/D-amino acid oxidase-like deaminating enzyme